MGFAGEFRSDLWRTDLFILIIVARLVVTE